jgi:hypothetical protein
MGRSFGARGGRGHGGDTSGEESRGARECFSEKSFVCGTSNAERPTSNVEFRVER